MDNGSNGFIEWLYKQGSLGAILGVFLFVGYNSIQAGIQELKEGQRELIGYMKDHEGRIANIEGRLDVMERRQQPAT